MEKHSEYPGVAPKDIPYFEKSEGNQKAQEQDFLGASKHYSKALLSIKELVKEKVFQGKDLNKIREDIEFPCYLNMALCELKLMNFDKALGYAEKALLIKPNSVKGNYRKALALIELGGLDDAQNALEMVLKEEPENGEARLQIKKIRAQKKDLDKQSAGFFQKCMQGLDYSDKPEAGQAKNDKKKGWLKRKIANIQKGMTNFARKVKRCASCRRNQKKKN